LKRLTLLLATAILAISGGTQRLEAGFILPKGAGNTFPTNKDGDVDGHVNFAVLDRSGGVLGDTWGTGMAGFDAFFVKDSIGFSTSGPLDTAARFLYLFQTVNDGVNSLEIGLNSVQVDPTAVTSFGVFFGLGFTESSVLTAAGGPYLGGASAAPGDKSGMSVGGSPGVAVNGAAVSPVDFNKTGSSLQAMYLFPALTPGSISMIWGYTSNAKPFIGKTSIIDGGTSANGTVPVNVTTPEGPLVPEPASFLMFGMGISGMCGYGLRRRKLVA